PRASGRRDAHRARRVVGQRRRLDAAFGLSPQSAAGYLRLQRRFPRRLRTVIIMTPSEYEKARRLLMRRDPILREAIRTIGPCLMADRQRKDHLTALIGAIVSQQLSTKAAATIFGRFAALFPDGQITADGVRALTDQQLRGAGFSGQKVGYLRDLCARIADGSLALDALDALPDA